MTQTKNDYQKSNTWIDRLRNYFTKLIRFRIESWKIAFSLALGVFIGLLLPMGFQTIVVIPLAVLLKCNIFITTSATLISNPVTVVPLYYSYFKVGEILTSIRITEDQFKVLINSPTFENIQGFGANAVILFFSGSFPISLLLGIVTYGTALVIVKSYRKKRGIETG